MGCSLRMVYLWLQQQGGQNTPRKQQKVHPGRQRLKGRNRYDTRQPMTARVPASSAEGWVSLTGVMFSEDDVLPLPDASLWLLSWELAGSVKGSWVELESDSITTSLS